MLLDGAGSITPETCVCLVLDVMMNALAYYFTTFVTFSWEVGGGGVGGYDIMSFTVCM
jgi:hypothetical protein